mgnify:CR=1 FL=1
MLQHATSRVPDAAEIDWDAYAELLPEYNMAEIKVCAACLVLTHPLIHSLIHSPSPPSLWPLT